ncbi:MAG TPA: sulfite exporter TauE/SafE family protein [Sphingomicrobium sp.]|nr:sulfite exporter TauE/SafE family protein [Sphingomicrobium sp.]
MTFLTGMTALASGLAIGLVLGLVGGGGSILAVPLLVYVVGVQSPHLAIGTAAAAVAFNALAGLVTHVRAGNVRWPCGLVFAATGVAGAALGAEAGKSFDGERLLLLFGLLMIGVGSSMLRKRRRELDPNVRLTRENARQMLPRLSASGLLVGVLAGFFGIGGGFLIVPALIFAAGLPIQLAIGTSLVVVAALGATTAASYALSGLVDWPLLGLLILGGAVGSGLGMRAGKWLLGKKRALELGFASVVILVGAYVSAKAGGFA